MVRASVLAAMLWAGSWQTGAAQQANVTGAWSLTLTLSDGDVRTGLAIFSQDDLEVTGMIGPAETEMMPAKGIVSEGKLILTTHPRRGRTAAFAKCEVTISGGRMFGTIDTDKGTIEFVKRPRSLAPPVNGRF